MIILISTFLKMSFLNFLIKSLLCNKYCKETTLFMQLHLIFQKRTIKKTNHISILQAFRQNISILVDAERPREGLNDLLDLADYVVCSENFPKVSKSYHSIRC